MRQPSRFSEVGFESMKMGVFLLFGRTKRPDLHRNSPPAFFAAFRWQLGARCSLDRCDNSRAAGVRLGRSFRPIRFGLLILLPQVLPRIKTKLISSEKEPQQLFDFIWAPRTEVPGLNDIKKLRCRSALVEATRLPSWAITSSGGRTPHHQPRWRAT